MEESSRITAVFAIGFITLLILLVINIYKVKKLKKENDTLKHKQTRKASN